MTAAPRPYLTPREYLAYSDLAAVAHVGFIRRDLPPTDVLAKVEFSRADAAASARRIKEEAIAYHPQPMPPPVCDRP